MVAIATAASVTGAANAIAAAGETPTIESIRQRIGGGSDSTIGPLLTNWKLSRPAAPMASDLAQVIQVEQLVHQVLEHLAQGSAAAQQRAAAAEIEAEEARQAAEHAKQASTQSKRERDAAIEAAAGATETAQEVVRLRHLLIAEQVERRRDRALLVALSRQIAVLASRFRRLPH